MGYEVRNNFLLKDGKLVKYHQSPNHGGSMKPRIIVIHYTGDNSQSGGLSWLCSPKSKVSAHLVIAKDGTVYQLLPFDIVAWHAGSSSYEGESGVNNFSIGIENVGVGDVWPAAQRKANREVIAALFAAYPIEDVVGHSDVAPGRKVDPGPLYPWSEVVDEVGAHAPPEFTPEYYEPAAVKVPAPKRSIIDVIRGWLKI